MKFKTGYIENVPYWGLFENTSVAKRVISDLRMALEDSNGEHNNGSGDYVIAFILDKHLYISRRNYYALVVNKHSTMYAKDTLVILPISSSGVLILSEEYFDDLPKFNSADDFCTKISQTPSKQYCVTVKI